MNTTEKTTEQPPALNSSRRSAIKSLAAGALAVAGLGASRSVAEAAPTPSRELDIAILNFALNLEYLEAEYYTYAVTGSGIETLGIGITGTGSSGRVRIKGNPQVNFQTAAFRDYAREIAKDERDHVTLLRTAIQQLGGSPVARPSIDLKESFDAAAAAAGIGASFDPFADEVSFLIGAFIFEDVGVTAYKGAAQLVKDPAVLTKAAGLLGVEAYHAGTVRTVLYGTGSRDVYDIVQKITRLRDAVDGDARKEQGLVFKGEANIVPTNESGLVFSRNAGQVLKIVYLGGETQGGFFPKGVNGTIR